MKQVRRSKLTIIDGPLGTELNARGVETPLPYWSAAAIEAAPEVIAEIHRDYANAGATVHTANTFRTRRRTVGNRWKRWTQQAVEIARNAVPPEHLVAGSLAPLEDCYRPDLSPKDCSKEHREMADFLAQCGCDLILCETFPHSGEAIEALRAGLATGLPTWLAMTAGPEGDWMSPDEMAQTAQRAVDEGASAVLVNCTPASENHRWIGVLAGANLNVPIGGYANAGSVDDQIGWRSPSDPAVQRYVSLSENWVRSGATVLGGCCGTGPAHLAALARLHYSTL